MYQDQRNIPHVGRRLNRGNELERNVGQTDERDDGSGNPVPEFVSREDAANEEVDCIICCQLDVTLSSPSNLIVLSRVFFFMLIPTLPLSRSHVVGDGWLHVQTPRPMKLNMKEAYLAT